MKPMLNEVTARIRERSAPPRRSDRMGCVNVAHGFGRELLGGMRKTVTGAEQGACTWL